MKKILAFCLLLISLVLTNLPLHVASAEVDLDLNTQNCILMEPLSHKVIFESNSHEKMFPASMTKMMGLYLVLEAINNNKISLDDKVTASKYACSMGGTQIFLEENEKMSVEDLLKAVAINSANDAIVALGEYVGSSNTNFVKMMNEKAKEFNMNDTHFVNATGFDDDNHYTSCFDMAILASHLLKYDKQILKYTSMQEAYLREDQDEKFWLVNTNKLLKYYEGMDGLKTGYTSKAGYNLTATAKRNNVRLVSVVMHEDSIASRSQDTTTLLDYGFSRYMCVRLFSKGDIISKYQVINYKDLSYNFIVKEDVDILLLKEEKKENVKIILEVYDLEPPIYKDDIVGRMVITTPSNMVFKYDLYSDEEVHKLNFFTLLINYLKSLFFN